MNHEDAPEYCRAIESYLCRKNDGHLVRVVGPAFDLVCGWAERGVPLKVACRGIDRYFERYYAKGPRRRPIRIEFCEADVLDVFDEWRRAIGVLTVRESADSDDVSAVEDAGRQRSSLPAHLDRVHARLAEARTGTAPCLEGVLQEVIRQLEATRAVAKTLRGDARHAAIERLGALDAMVLDAARAGTDGAALAEMQAEAESELTAFRARMPAEAYTRALAACVDRIVRERHRLPRIAFDG